MSATSERAAPLAGVALNSDVIGKLLAEYVVASYDALDAAWTSAKAGGDKPDFPVRVPGWWEPAFPPELSPAWAAVIKLEPDGETSYVTFTSDKTENVFLSQEIRLDLRGWRRNAAPATIPFEIMPLVMVVECRSGDLELDINAARTTTKAMVTVGKRMASLLDAPQEVR